jgi:hypothetical protein
MGYVTECQHVAIVLVFECYFLVRGLNSNHIIVVLFLQLRLENNSLFVIVFCEHQNYIT